MKKLALAVLVAWGAWHYAAPHLTMAAAMDYAHKNQDKPWAATLAYSVGWFYYQRANYPKAQEALSSFVNDFQAGPHTATGLVRLSEAAEENHDYAAARAALDRYLHDYPDDPDRNMAQQRRDMMSSR
jgi:outer membrane protein assembly factor BamD (BamD/ComL family)